MIYVSLRGSYAPDDFFATIAAALGAPSPHDFAGLETLLSQAQDEEIEFTWQDFHQAKVGELEAMEVANTLRTAAQANSQLRLIFFDSNRGGQ